MRLLQSHPDSDRFQGIFIGRMAERSRLAEWTEKAAGGQSWAVLLEGSAGIGRTALLRRGAPSPASFCVVHSTCDPGELNLPFGLVSQLLWRARCHITAAASAADRLSADEQPARVGGWLLDIVYAAQASQPLAIIIDDLQWADPGSVEAISYMLRRLDNVRVLTLLSARTQNRAPAEWVTGPGGHWRRLIDDRQFGQRIHLPGLTAEEVADLAARFGHGAIPLAAAERLRQHTAGNPASLQALLTDPRIESLVRGDRPFPAPGSVAAQVGWLLTALAPASRDLLDALAVLDAKCPLGLAARVAGVSDPVAALEPLIRAEIVQWWPEDPVTPVQVWPPVQRDAVYQRLTPGRRRELHLKAAAVVRGDARWAHRVAAVAGPDGALADELESAAGQVLDEGDAERAGTLLLWAADLSDNWAAYERRLLVAAAQLIWSSSFGRAEALRPRLADCAARPLRDLILCTLGPDEGHATSVSSLLAAALSASAVSDSGDGLRMAQAAGRVALMASHGHADRGDSHARGAIAHQVLAIKELDRETRTMAECLAAEAAGQWPGDTALLSAMESASVWSSGSDERVRAGDAILLWRRGAWRARAGHLTAAADDLAAALRISRGPGELNVAANTLLAYVQYHLGQWKSAAATVEQAISLALSRGATWSYTKAHAVAACVAASGGRLEEAEDLLRTCRRWWSMVGSAADVVFPAVAAATLAQAKGDYAAMLAALGPVCGMLDETNCADNDSELWRLLQVEALIGTGRLDEAAVEVAKRTDVNRPYLRAGHGWLAGWLAHARGDLEAAKAIYADALSIEIPHDDVPLLRARLEHGYGLLLLAQHSRRPAVNWLRSARDRYLSLGAAPFLARCDADLNACGLRTIAADPDAIGVRRVLSGQEDRVARLVAQGMTNQEVARQLYVSTKTVEFHLSNIFTKLGITSRRQLSWGYLPPGG
jgi:ATP/maltotriose-dependent transcriptional regulator MalT